MNYGSGEEGGLWSWDLQMYAMSYGSEEEDGLWNWDLQMYAMNYGSVEEGGLWNWDVSLTFASIVCATDPVAVVGALHELGAPKKHTRGVGGVQGGYKWEGGDEMSATDPVAVVGALHELGAPERYQP
ncbi:hypothetical protein T492DRAFT_848991 [Pavlovales sp. CCMP2436]|nr:hypothetical protein T492DRAFT_848991 [Pavlovales sp. CCMP2436]